MTTSTKPALAPTSKTSDHDTSAGHPDVSAQSSAAVALAMSWQLLVVVILPIVGGHLLDVRLTSSPDWMIAGILVGLVGTIVVVRRAMRDLNDIMNRNKDPK